MKSMAIVFTGPRTVEWREEDVADPGPNHVIVQTLVSLVSTGTESWCYRGEFDADTGWAAWVRYPFLPGYSNVGRVVKIGEGVTDVREGDRVYSAATHTQYAAVEASGSRFLKLPDHARNEDAAWATLSFITQTAVRHAEHSMGDNAVVLGLGPLGQLVIQYLRAIGLNQILAVDLAPKRLEMARAHGATATFSGSAGDAVEFVKDHTGGRLADVVYDVTGALQRVSPGSEVAEAVWHARVAGRFTASVASTSHARCVDPATPRSWHSQRPASARTRLLDCAASNRAFPRIHSSWPDERFQPDHAPPLPSRCREGVRRLAERPRGDDGDIV